MLANLYFQGSSDQADKRDKTAGKQTPKTDPNDATEALVKEIKNINLNEFTGKKISKVQSKDVHLHHVITLV